MGTDHRSGRSGSARYGPAIIRTTLVVVLMGSWAASLAARNAAWQSNMGTAAVASDWRYIDGAPPGFAGGFGENTCDACHFEAPPNTTPGAVTITGIPDVFMPGARYDFTVRLEHAAAIHGGFQLTARLAEAGAQAGSLAPGSGHEDRVKIETQNGIEYVNQRREGTTRPDDVFLWVLRWTAPDVPTGTVVQFHVAANAADNDETAEGDFVFTTTLESRAGGASPEAGAGPGSGA